MTETNPTQPHNVDDKIQHPRQDPTKSEEGEIETDPEAMDSIKEDLSDGGQSEALKDIQKSEDAPPPDSQPEI